MGRISPLYSEPSRLRAAGERSLPISIGVCLLFIGLENLVLLWLSSAEVMWQGHLPALLGLGEMWGPVGRAAIPTALTVVHGLMLVYLWVLTRGSRDLRRSWAPLGTALLLVVQQVTIVELDLAPRESYRVQRLDLSDDPSIPPAPAPAVFSVQGSPPPDGGGGG